MKLLIVVLCYRVPDLAIDCLRSLNKEINNVPDTRVVLCENGTGGDAAERIGRVIDEENWGSWCQLTAVYPNRGFCAGNNLVIRPVLESDDPPEYVLLLNADTIVLDHALASLVEFMDGHPEAGIAGSQFLSPTGAIQTSPFRFIGILSELDQGLKLGIVSRMLSRWVISPPTPAAAREADWVSGASMILRRTMLEQIGLLDEGLFTYFDDIDICLRARRTGWKTWYVPESRIIHLEGASTGVATRIVKRRPAYWYQARRRFLLKSYGGFYTALVDAAYILGYSIWHLRCWIQRKQNTDPPSMLFDAIRHSVFCTGFSLQEVENPAMCTAIPAK